MKSETLCACIVAILILSSIAFGEILESSGWDGDCGGDPESSTPSVTADSSNVYAYSWGSGWEYTYTTVTAGCDWNYDIYAYAEGSLTLYNNKWASASAGACASAYCPYDYNYNGDNTASISLYDSGDGGEHPTASDLDDEEPGGVYRNGWATFQAYEGVSVSSDAFAAAEVEEGSSCGAYAHGCAHATGGMN